MEISFKAAESIRKLDSKALSRRSAGAAIGAVLASASWPTYAQSDYPVKPIKLIVPFPAGGGGDTLARTVVARLNKELPQPIVVENIPGAGGNIGSVSALKSPADGYTLLYGTNGTLCANHVLYRRAGFDPLKDLVHISRLSRLGLVAVVRQGLEVNSMADLVKLLRSKPGKFNYASAGNGTTSHLAMELLKTQAKLAVVHIPYSGGAGAMAALIAGQIDLMIEVQPNALPHINSGRIKALAVSTLTRSPALPNVPTMAQSGLADFEVTAWDGIVAPTGTPPAIITKLNGVIQKALADPEIVKTLESRGAIASPTSPEDFKRFMYFEVSRWAGAVIRSGARVD
jgi:tripartite-type tricarboxylate transporter receptor subunit TctC